MIVWDELFDGVYECVFGVEVDDFEVVELFDFFDV